MNRRHEASVAGIILDQQLHYSNNNNDDEANSQEDGVNVILPNVKRYEQDSQKFGVSTMSCVSRFECAGNCSSLASTGEAG